MEHQRAYSNETWIWRGGGQSVGRRGRKKESEKNPKANKKNQAFGVYPYLP